MKIQKVQLVNIRSYKGSSPAIEFHDGVNFLAGENGSGKSTVMEAIGTALFDAIPGDLKALVSHGAKSGEISVWFEDEGERFHVRRRLGQGASSWVVYRVTRSSSGLEEDEPVAERSDEVIRFLCRRLHFTTGSQLKSAFEHAIGVRQGTFTAAFALTPTQRKRIFDEIINVEHYRNRAEEHREVRTQYVERDIASARGRIDLAQSYLDEHAGDPALLGDVERRRDELGIALSRLAAQKTTLTAQRATVESGRARVNDLARTLARLDEAVGGAAAAAKSAREEAAAARMAKEICDRTAADRAAYEDSQARLKDLEEQRSRRDSLRARLNDAEKQVAESRASLEAARRALDEAAGRETRELVEQQAKVNLRAAKDREACEIAAELETRLHELERFRSRDWTAQGAQKEAARQIHHAKQLDETLTQLTGKIGEQAQLLAGRQQVEEKARALSRAQTELNALKARETELSTEIRQLRANREELRNLVCPFIREHCDRVRPEVFEEKLSPLNASLIELGARMETSDTACREALEADRALPRLDEISKEQDRTIRDAEKTRTKLRAAVESIARLMPAATLPKISPSGPLIDAAALDVALDSVEKDAAEAREALAAAQAAEGRARGALTGALRAAKEAASEEEKAREQAASTREDIEQRRRDCGRFSETLELKQRDADGLSAQLSPFVHLDLRISEERSRAAANFPGREEYVRNAQAAAEVPKRETNAAAAVRKLAETTEDRTRCVESLAEAQRAFDPSEFDRIVVALAEVDRANGSAVEEGRQLDQRRLELAHIVEEMEKRGREIIEQERESKRLESLKGVLDDLWKILRDAGPRISARLLANISLRANGVFQTLQNRPGSLRWDENYELKLQTPTGEVSFNGLSGGEKVSAALSVQMAMARDFAQASFCIFDEPTEHLDEAHRQRLPEAIRGAQREAGFTQVFIVSHDDTFNSYVDHTIRLLKETDGTTRLVE